MSGFAVLLTFALLKVVIGAMVVYLGLRGGGRDEPDDGFGGVEPAPEPPPHLPSRRRVRRRAPVRGGPNRMPPRRVRVARGRASQSLPWR